MVGCRDVSSRISVSQAGSSWQPQTSRAAVSPQFTIHHNSQFTIHHFSLTAFRQIKVCYIQQCHLPVRRLHPASAPACAPARRPCMDPPHAWRGLPAAQGGLANSTTGSCTDDNASWSGTVLPKLVYTRRLNFTLACMRQAEAGDALDQRWALCLLLILERARGSASAWAPYIRILPARYGALVIQCSTALWH